MLEQFLENKKHTITKRLKSVLGRAKKFIEAEPSLYFRNMSNLPFWAKVVMY